MFRSYFFKRLKQYLELAPSAPGINHLQYIANFLSTSCTTLQIPLKTAHTHTNTHNPNKKRTRKKKKKTPTPRIVLQISRSPLFIQKNKFQDHYWQNISVQEHHTLLYFWREGVFNEGPAKGMDKLVSRNFSDNKPPITVPYLHQNFLS